MLSVFSDEIFTVIVLRDLIVLFSEFHNQTYVPHIER